ncbi:MAG: bacteriocin [Lachnospiraceae bacterium]|nr:bacteriocin [Lachnospiraceae bacterium]
MSNVNFEERFKNAKKTNRVLKKLNENELDNVSGGFLETRGGYANGCIITCPFCGARSADSFSAWEGVPSMPVDGYECVCGGVFFVDSTGTIYI